MRSYRPIPMDDESFYVAMYVDSKFVCLNSIHNSAEEAQEQANKANAFVIMEESTYGAD